MDYAQAQRNPGKHLTGIGIVIVMHLLLGYALVTGLARKVVEVIKAPIETKIIEEVKPPPPPETPPPPPPKMALPPPSFVPPPEVQIANPPPAPTITVQTTTPPPAAPVTIAPPPGPVASAPAVAARPAVIDVSTCEKPSYPPAAARAEAKGTTKIRFTVDASGHVDASKTTIERSSGMSREHKLLDRAAVEALSKCRFKPGTDAEGRPVGGYSIVDYVWNLE